MACRSSVKGAAAFLVLCITAGCLWGDRSPLVNSSLDAIIFALPSPNQEPRPPGAVIDTIVLHHTASWNAQGALRTLTSPTSGVSAHFTIDESGLIYQHVSTENIAWHAGPSLDDRGRERVNDFSIGIELVNKGNGYDPYHEPQIASLRALIDGLKRRHPLKYIVSHTRIARPRGRKSDPKGFPWRRVSDLGLTVEP